MIPSTPPVDSLGYEPLRLLVGKIRFHFPSNGIRHRSASPSSPRLQRPAYLRPRRNAVVWTLRDPAAAASDSDDNVLRRTNRCGRSPGRSVTRSPRREDARRLRHCDRATTLHRPVLFLAWSTPAECHSPLAAFQRRLASHHARIGLHPGGSLVSGLVRHAVVKSLPGYPSGTDAAPGRPQCVTSRVAAPTTLARRRAPTILGRSLLPPHQ